MASADLPEKRPGDEPFESETEIEDKSGGKGVIGTLRPTTWGAWCEDDLTGMVVRGIHFMADKKKVDCAPPIYKLMHADIFKTKKEEDKDRCAHYAANPDSWAAQRWERLQAKKAAMAAAAAAAAGDAASADPASPSPAASSPSGSPSPASSPSHAASHAATASIALSEDPLAPLIVINFLIPGSGFNMNLVLYFARRIKTADTIRKERAAAAAANPGRKQPAPRPSQPAAAYSAAEFESDEFPHDLERLAAFDKLLAEFLHGADEWRDCRLKIVPRVAEGNWVVKKSIGRVPAILGKKVKQFYYRNPDKNYIEIDADLGTSAVAGKIIQLIKGTCKGLVVDLSFLFQGEDRTELPESLIGGVRMIRVDLDKITWRSENNERNRLEFDV